ncbi:MAG: hypothetical protein HOH43_12655 [Candidatus Latescibacteria bacterium]|jgi:ankyrin repeat protein|nr:hypothetical protein [Candidatus Latescibacterota bacterium]
MQNERVNESQRQIFVEAREAIKCHDMASLTTCLTKQPLIVTWGDTSDSGYSGYTLLHYAAGGDTLRHPDPTPAIRSLLAAGAEVNNALQGGATPLHFAASLNHMQALGALLNAGADVTLEAEGTGGTPLVHALFYGCTGAAEALSKYVVAPDNLRVRSGLGHCEQIEKFFKSDGTMMPLAGSSRGFYRPHDEFPEWCTSDSPQEVIDEAFVYASLNGRLEVLGLLLSHGAQISAKPYFASALHHAAWNGYPDVVAWLLERGADPANRDDHYHGEPWGWAFFGGHPEIRQSILQVAAGVDLVSAVVFGDPDRFMATLHKGVHTIKQRSQALARAYENDENEMVQALRENGVEPSFEVAARHGLVDDVRRYLENGEDPSAALTPAADSGQKEICRMLIEAGAIPTNFQMAALNMVRELEGLVKADCAIDAMDESGSTMLHHAIRGNALDTVAILLANGASIHKPYDGFTFGGTALHVAAASNSDESIFDLLLEYQADINQQSNEGTPLDTASREGNVNAVVYIEARGGKSAEQLGDWPHSRKEER